MCCVVLCCVSCCVVLRRVVSSRVVSCRVLSCAVVWCGVLCCALVWCRVVSCRVVWCRVASRRGVLCSLVLAGLGWAVSLKCGLAACVLEALHISFLAALVWVHLQQQTPVDPQQVLVIRISIHSGDRVVCRAQGKDDRDEGTLCQHVWRRSHLKQSGLCIRLKLDSNYLHELSLAQHQRTNSFTGHACSPPWSN